MFLNPIEFRPVSWSKLQNEGRFSTNRVLLQVNNFGLNIQRWNAHQFSSRVNIHTQSYTFYYLESRWKKCLTDKGILKNKMVFKKINVFVWFIVLLISNKVNAITMVHASVTVKTVLLDASHVYPDGVDLQPTTAKNVEYTQDLYFRIL